MEMDEDLADLCYRPARSAEAFGTICVSSALVSVRFISADRISDSVYGLSFVSNPCWHSFHNAWACKQNVQQDLRCQKHPSINLVIFSKLFRVGGLTVMQWLAYLSHCFSWHSAKQDFPECWFLFCCHRKITWAESKLQKNMATFAFKNNIHVSATIKCS